MTPADWVLVEIDRPEARMSFRIEAYEEAGRIVCGIYDIRGTRRAGPKAFVRAVRKEMARLEDHARSLGAQEMRFSGRWGRHVLLGYSQVADPDDPMKFRKTL